MWLCTQHGFFSVVQKKAGEYHVRARVRQDLVNLVDLVTTWPPDDAKIIETRDADYRFRIVVGPTMLQDVMWAMAWNLDYENFKGRIALLPDQRDKSVGYHRMWDIGREWQAWEERRGDRESTFDEDEISRLIYSGVDGTKQRLKGCTAKDLPLLQEALKRSREEGRKTSAKMIAAKIKQLTKEGA